MKTSASTNSATINYATAGLLLVSIRRLIAMLVAVALLISSQTKVIDAFLLTTTPTWSACTKSTTTTKYARSCSNTTTLHARKYIVIGGNIDGINPNQEEDTYNMSKKERRRREREKGDANFKSGAYKKKKQTMKEKAMGVNFDKLDDKVSAIFYFECQFSGLCYFDASQHVLHYGTKNTQHHNTQCACVGDKRTDAISTRNTKY
jgi:hypothetical protein